MSYVNDAVQGGVVGVAVIGIREAGKGGKGDVLGLYWIADCREWGVNMGSTLGGRGEKCKRRV